MNIPTVPTTRHPALTSPCVATQAAAVIDARVVTVFLNIFAMLVLPSPPSGGFCFWCYVKANVSSGPDHNFLYHSLYYFRRNILLPDPFTIDLWNLYD
jgi:hypothetical protein